MRSAPVGDDHSGKSPFIAEYPVKEHVIFSAPPAVNLVIGSHHAVGIGLFNGSPEGGEVDLAQGPFTDCHIYCPAIVFLVVQRVMFQADRDSVVLHAAGIPDRKLRAQERVFAKVFISSSACGNSLDIYCRSEQHIFSAQACFPCHCSSV